MRASLAIFALTCLFTPAFAQEPNEGPSDDKAQKTYKQAFEELQKKDEQSALDKFKKADKQDGGHCVGCQKQMFKYALKYEDWKTASLAADEMLAQAHGTEATAIAHYEVAYVLFSEAMRKHKDDLFSGAHDELTKALGPVPNFPEALYLDGRALAFLHQDDAAKAEFEKYVKMKAPDDPLRQRALRYIERPELVRARMAPAFSVTALDGKRISMDDLQGKVVLIDFWATWCGPCREALPHIQKVAKKFDGEPLVILSISLDSDTQKWKEFVAKNEMTWPQYCDGGFTGSIARSFGVNAIPHTFTIDADGVLQDEHIGDASIEGKLKKLIARAHELEASVKAGK